MEIAKINEEQRLVFGWANVAVTADGEVIVDWQNDLMDPSVLEKAAYEFNLEYRATGEMHKGVAKGRLVESVVFTIEKLQAMGIPEGILPLAWWVGFFIEDETTFAKIKDGTYKMFSIQGRAKREVI
jgi:hypothetical protein